MSARPTASQSSEPTLLVIDDDYTIGRSLARILEGEPFRVLHAPNEETANEILANERVDVVVCDRHMPNCDGLAILSELRRSHPNVVRIMLTSDEESSTFIRALSDAGVRRFLHKPWNDEQLRGSVRQAFGLPARIDCAERKAKPAAAKTPNPPGPRRGSLARLAAMLGVSVDDTK